MGRSLSLLRDAPWPAIWIAIGLLGAVGFLREMGFAGLQSWGVAAAIVAGTTIAVLTLPRESLPRALIWFGALVVTAFLSLYNVLDAILDPVIHTDWPIAGLAIALILGLAAVLAVLVSDED